jgi:hypothetical protein
MDRHFFIIDQRFRNYVSKSKLSKLILETIIYRHYRNYNQVREKYVRIYN